MSKASVLSLQSLERNHNNDDPIGSHISIDCKTHSSISLIFCVRPR